MVKSGRVLTKGSVVFNVIEVVWVDDRLAACLVKDLSNIIPNTEGRSHWNEERILQSLSPARKLDI